MRTLLRLLRDWLPVIVWTAIILSAANDQFSDENTASLLERLLGGPLPREVNVVVRKFGHLFAYAVLALLAFRAQRKFVPAFLLALAIAIIDETMQAMTLTREGSLWDVLLDSSGAGLALLVWRVWQSR